MFKKSQQNLKKAKEFVIKMYNKIKLKWQYVIMRIKHLVCKLFLRIQFEINLNSEKNQT